MTDDMTALARRVVACKGWRWLPGTLRLRVTSPGMRDHLKREGRVLDWDDTWVYPAWPVIPDLTDAATLGCLLALVRDAWRSVVVTSPDYDYDDEEARQGPHVVGWRAVETVRWLPIGVGPTEAAALVAALEGAP
jgi:hypothetical protein